MYNISRHDSLRTLSLLILSLVLFLLLFPLFFFFNDPATPEFSPLPTRRSSDLSGMETLLLRLRGHRAHRVAGALLREGDRSEEHTSELQSHLNLVCRLLLEKKKICRARHRIIVALVSATLCCPVR